MDKVQFKISGQGPDGARIYDLWIDSEPVRTGLDIEDVIRIIGDHDEAALPRRVPAAFRTPEEARGSWERRECPKAL